MSTITQQKQENIIQLPNPNEKFLQDSQQLRLLAKHAKEEHCQEVLEFVVEQLLANLRSFGVFADPDRIYYKDFGLVEQSIAGLLYRYYGLEHPAHDVAEQVISVESEQEEETEENDIS